MKISYIPDSMGELDFDTMLLNAASLGIEAIEFTTGNWSKAPHLDLERMLTNRDARIGFKEKLEDHNLSIAALNCSGNPLAYEKDWEVTLKTFELASLLDVRKIVMMSGLPPGTKGDRTPVWITTSWPPETQDILRYQWEDAAIPKWELLKKEAQNCGISKIALENHGWQLVFNPETMFRLREAIGPIIGMNLDPSHLFWMGGDPMEAARVLGEALYHVHAKDSRSERRSIGPNGYLDTKPIEQFRRRSWNYTAVGAGHGVQWWAEFFSVLRQIGYDDAVSLEMEDLSMEPMAGIRLSLQTIRQALGR